MWEGDNMCSRYQLNIVTDKMVKIYREAYGDDIVTILLYGSYARNEQSEQSDVDIVAIVNGNREELQLKLKRIWEESADVSLENDVVISPTVIPFNEYEKYKTELPYYMNIDKEGIKVG